MPSRSVLDLPAWPPTAMVLEYSLVLVGEKRALVDSLSGARHLLPGVLERRKRQLQGCRVAVRVSNNQLSDRHRVGDRDDVRRLDVFAAVCPGAAHKVFCK